MAVAHHHLEVRASTGEWFEHISKGAWAAVYLTSPQGDFLDSHRLYLHGLDRFSQILFLPLD
jgi:hypothetical protein